MKNEETNTGQAILKAAEELFLEQGFEQTTTKQIAQRAGCNQALLHYYYRTKDNLFVQIFEEKVKFIATHFLDINLTAQTLEERISQMVEVHFELFRKNPRLVPFLLKEVLSDPVRVAPILDKIKQYMVKIFGIIDEALHEEIEKGAARPVSTLNVILTLVSLDMAPFIIAPVLQRVLDLTDEQLDEQLDKRKPEVVEILLRQIRKSPFEPV
ncbi:MAG TPA: TetR/AcrR family transcriptional regulator [Candidatus Caccoplasma merdavium]|nr:TetR/AcrR family transcriptional regulator [Candidatus Caccoplasma merdavium]